MRTKYKKPLSDQELEQLIDFIGYGALDTPIWFVGIEEGGSEKRLRNRLAFSQVEDLKNAHIKAGHKRNWGEVELQDTWARMCWVMLELEGKDIYDQKLTLEYQANKLGRADGDTLLTELFPLPKKRLKDWGFGTLLPKVESQRKFKRRVRKRRFEKINELIKAYKPKVVFFYGRYWENHKDRFDPVRFSKRKKFLFATSGETLFILSNHFVLVGRDQVRDMVKFIKQNVIDLAI